MPGNYGLAEMSLPQPVPGIGVVRLLFGLAMAEAMSFLFMQQIKRRFPHRREEVFPNIF